MTSRTKRIILGISVAGIVVAAGIGAVLTTKVHPPLPSEVRRKVSFVSYVPASPWQIKADTPAYANGVLSFTATRENDDVTLGITQQPAPEIFTDVPQYYPTLLDKLHRYASFGTKNGTVYLTHPEELTGGQQAVVTNNGTLIFAHPSKNLSEDEWRKFFNSLRELTP